MNLIVRMEFGSKVGGYDVPESDTDYKGISIPNARDILLQKAFRGINNTTGDNFSRNGPTDIDDEIYSLHNYCKLLSEGQTGALDMLFTPKHHIIQRTSLWTYIQRHKDKFLSKNMKSFIGYCVGQSSKYSLKGDHMKAYQDAYEWFQKFDGINYRVGQADIHLLCNLNPLCKVVELPDANGSMLSYLQVGPKTKVPFTATTKTAATIYKEQFDKYGARAKLAMDNKGLDLKALLHAVRVIHEGIELCRTGHITFPRPEADLLLKIRKNELPFQQISEMIDAGVATVKIEMEKSSLPEKPNILFIENFVCNIYANHISKIY